MTALPEKFEEAIRSQLRDAFPDFLNSLQNPPPVSIRTHPVKKATISVESPVPWSELGRYLSTRPIFTFDPLFHAGTYYVQEASSMFLEQALKQTVDLGSRLKILDLCAAPGGKSTHILSLINRDSLLVTNEAIRSRANILSENVQKWGYPNAIVTNNDPSDFAQLRGFFDVIVVDAPCSGEGLFRKEPEAVEEWSPENVQLCAGRQKRIISNVWNALREEGIFVYCTCTYNTLENEENLKWIQKNNEVEFLKLSTDPTWGVEEVHEGNLFAYRCFPHKVKGEGFFLAVMRKKESIDSIPIKPKKPLPAPSSNVRQRLQDWVKGAEGTRSFQFNDLLFYTPQSLAGGIEVLLQSMKIVYAGTNVATIKHDKLIPEHAFALSLDINRHNFPAIEVSKDEALKYLRRENIVVSGTSTGFALLTYQEVPLGWVNVLSNRTNNMYPSHWRIRRSGER